MFVGQGWTTASSFGKHGGRRGISAPAGRVVLNCPDGPPELRESYGFTRAAVARIGSDLVRHLPDLCPRWREIHGDF